MKNVKLAPKMTKKNQIKTFSKLLSNFMRFSTNFVDWNIEKSQQGKILLSSSLSQKMNAVFKNE